MKIKGVNYIGNSTSNQNKDYLQAVNPETNTALPEKFYIATGQEIDTTLEKATSAFESYKQQSGTEKADFLDAIAEEILSLGETLLLRAKDESGLTLARLEGERGRTVNQIKIFADMLREGSWVDARIDTKPVDVRTMYFPLGPVAVFGASNFPLAFSTAGGDTASALAAGCPVVVKSHESHPGTNELVAGAIIRAAQKTGMPEGVFNSLNGGPEVGSALIQHPAVKAVGFTGSYKAGKSIYDVAQQREEPIPVYAEMGSVNPVFLLPDKLEQSAGELAEQYVQSVTLGNGQFCTKPGLLIGIAGESLESFKKQLAQKLKQTDADCMLNAGISEAYKAARRNVFSQRGVETLLQPEENENGTFGSAALAFAKASEFLSNKNLHKEVFGPFTLLISCSGKEEMKQVAAKLEGQLTVTFMGTEDELPEYKPLVSLCREKAGRVIFNGVPTGVQVAPAMHHGGPFPATTDSKFTSVGTTAIRRFVRPIAFQESPDELLPEELKRGNPLGIYRWVNGELAK